MAVSSSFKQKCPSCEAMVTIKDPSLVGKKVECSKCKDRFIVESPIEQDKAAVKKARADEDGKTNGKNGNGAKAKNGTAAKPETKKCFKDEDLEEHDEKKPAKAKAGAATAGAAKKQCADAEETPRKGKKQIVDDDDDEEQPKSGALLKLILGLGLAVVGVSVLAVAAWLILSGGSSTTPPRPGGLVAAGGPAIVDDKGKKGDAPPPKDDDHAKAPTTAAAGPGPEQTNLLPGDTEHVLHLFMKDLFESGGALRDAVFQTDHSLAGVNFKKRLGFDLLDVADIVRGEKYTAPAWSMAVLFLNEPTDEKAVSAALGLKKAESIKNQIYYQATKPNPTFDHLAGFTFGVPHKLRLAAARGERKLFVRFHDAHTVVVGDQEPIAALLRVEGHFPELTHRPTPTAPVTPANGGPGSPMPWCANARLAHARLAHARPADARPANARCGIAGWFAEAQLADAWRADAWCRITGWFAGTKLADAVVRRCPVRYRRVVRRGPTRRCLRAPMPGAVSPGGSSMPSAPMPGAPMPGAVSPGGSSMPWRRCLVRQCPARRLQVERRPVAIPRRRSRSTRAI